MCVRAYIRGCSIPFRLNFDQNNSKNKRVLMKISREFEYGCAETNVLLQFTPKWLLLVRIVDSQRLFRLKKYRVLINNPDKLPIVQVSVSQPLRGENVSISL